MNYNKKKEQRHRLLHSPQKRVEYLSEPDTPEKSVEEKKKDEEARLKEIEARKAEKEKQPAKKVRRKLNL